MYPQIYALDHAAYKHLIFFFLTNNFFFLLKWLGINIILDFIIIYFNANNLKKLRSNIFAPIFSVSPVIHCLSTILIPYQWSNKFLIDKRTSTFNPTWITRVKFLLFITKIHKSRQSKIESDWAAALTTEGTRLSPHKKTIVRIQIFPQLLGEN